jgi:hypothetical protein
MEGNGRTMLARELGSDKETVEAGKPTCDLADVEAGDSFRLILRVSTALDRAGRPALGTEFWDAAMRMHSYGEVIDLARRYVEVAT